MSLLPEDVPLYNMAMHRLELARKMSHVSAYLLNEKQDKVLHGIGVILRKKSESLRDIALIELRGLSVQELKDGTSKEADSTNVNAGFDISSS